MSRGYGNIIEHFKDLRNIAAFAEALGIPDAHWKLNDMHQSVIAPHQTRRRGALVETPDGTLGYLEVEMKVNEVVSRMLRSLPATYMLMHGVQGAVSKGAFGLWTRRLLHDAGLVCVRRETLPRPSGAAWEEAPTRVRLAATYYLGQLALLNALWPCDEGMRMFTTGFATTWMWRDLVLVSGTEARSKLLELTTQARRLLIKSNALLYKVECDRTLYGFNPRPRAGHVSMRDLMRETHDAHEA